ncbi:MAG: type II secretion system protein GspG [Kiritimatiellia bacterium]|jgi:general secretion pathway protein G|nr:type II secretion system protein GspG [Kiritimatiellia bacterium]MDP6809358.1 type II secretion system protein GspG [Kiritimatiellia bacterium]MDP7023964.1 type II secretion system protein GspG [Kiritimatiellia bacterium]
MTLRCPYCKGTFSADAGVKCPHCGKFVNLPRHLRPDEKPLRVQRRDHSSRFEEHHRETLTPTFQFGRKPSTLLVALGVLVIVGAILVARVSARFGKTRHRTRGMVAVEAVETLATAAGIFAEECGHVPSEADGFIALISNPGIEGWDGPYITLIKPDPWEEPYRYAVTNGVAIITSSGPDRTPGTSDDIMATTDE